VAAIETRLAASDTHIRLVSRICNEFFLDSAIGVSEFFKGELLTGLVFMAILRENVRHIDHGSPEAKTYGSLSSPPADEVREPVTIYVIAKVLGLTYETARRHVKRLVDDGYCLRLERGLVVPAEVLLKPDMIRASHRNLAAFNTLLHNAVRAGVVEEVGAG
jgi:hypothetical protein